MDNDEKLNSVDVRVSNGKKNKLSKIIEYKN